MKAAVCLKYGPPEVLQIEQVKKPVPEDNEVLVKIHASTVTKYDCWQRSATAPPGFGLISRIFSGIRKPKITTFGIDLAGEIESVGKDVTKFKEGDQVYGFSAVMYTHAEYICVPEDGAVALKPANTGYEEAASIPYGALTALYFLMKANIQNGQKVLIFGASGGLGTAAVQLARYFGAEVTGVCSTGKLELVRSLGVDKVIDYTQEDFSRNRQAYDIIFDTVGKSLVLGCKRSLKQNGTYVLATFGLLKLLAFLWLMVTSRKKIVVGKVEARSEDLIFLKEIIEAGKFRPVIDKQYTLEQISEAHRYVESGNKKGNVVVTIDHND